MHTNNEFLGLIRLYI